MRAFAIVAVLLIGLFAASLVQLLWRRRRVMLHSEKVASVCFVAILCVVAVWGAAQVLLDIAFGWMGCT